eukprot:3290182-Rhodomonas_salina.1
MHRGSPSRNSGSGGVKGWNCGGESIGLGVRRGSGAGTRGRPPAQRLAGSQAHASPWPPSSRLR